MRLFLLLFLVSVFSLNANSQMTFPKISSGVLYANIKSKRVIYKDINPYRMGWWLTVQQRIKIHKKLNFDFGITYQERIPLESYLFVGAPQAGVPYVFVIKNWPSNPQNQFFEEGFKRFPNFRYINGEFSPSFTFRRKKIHFSIALGIFGSALLNKNQVIKEQSDFPGFEDIFTSREIKGNIQYHKYDFGWIPKLAFQYEINEQIKLGIQFKSYQSLVRLNDTLVDDVKPFNMFWVAYAGGLSFQYRFKNKLN